ncbi:MAG: adenylate/guanylate cyclase domain-containing protein [Arenicellales bacterium]|nr:adenylate/guanylate cyclase domain-containing protein [Arenicellales bacterium]
MTERKLAAILHADVVGSTRLVQLNETLAHDRIRDMFRRFSETINKHDGIAHEVRGDAIVAEFARTSDALSAALDFQATNTAFNQDLSDEVRPAIRVGIAMGEVVVADNTITGEGVVLAQRLEQLAEAGGVCIQGAAYETVPKRLPFHYENLGEHELKGFDEPVRVYTVSQKTSENLSNPKDLSGPEVGEKESDKPSIAVLPFNNMSGDPEQEYFSDGITEDIITALSRISGLSVIARNTIMVYKDKAVDVKQVGQEQGVQYVLEGSVRKAGNRVRVTAQLIDTDTGHHQWADRYDRNLDDIFAVQDDITHNIAVEMRVQLSLGEKARMLAGRTQSVVAWEKQLLADELNNSFIQGDNWRARRLCEEALAIDPNYVSAWTELGWTYLEDVLCGWTDSVEESLRETSAAVDKALGLEQDYPFALSLLGYVYAMKGDYDRAVEVSEKAVMLAPENAEGVAELAHMLLFAGRADEALAVIKKAIRLCPMRLMWHLTIMGQCQQATGALELAIATFREAVLKGSDSPFPRICLISALMDAGDRQEAIHIAQEVLQLERSFSLSRWRGAHFKDPSVRERVADQLAEAGLPL